MAPHPNRIRAAIDALPARPGIVIGLVLVAGVLSVFYYTTYTACTHNARLRAQLMTGIEAASGAQVRLADVMGFTWDKIRIAQAFRPPGKVTSCPFGWDWSSEERQRLTASGLLTVIAFLKADRPVEVIDVSGEDVRFDDLKDAYTSDEAVFAVERQDGGAPRFVLKAAGIP
ncbi:MAG: hypothetical protein ACR2PM_18050 [Hyphomicrobiales bacterium]